MAETSLLQLLPTYQMLHAFHRQFSARLQELNPRNLDAVAWERLFDDFQIDLYRAFLAQQHAVEHLLFVQDASAQLAVRLHRRTVRLLANPRLLLAPQCRPVEYAMFLRRISQHLTLRPSFVASLLGFFDRIRRLNASLLSHDRRVQTRAVLRAALRQLPQKKIPILADPRVAAPLASPDLHLCHFGEYIISKLEHRNQQNEDQQNQSQPGLAINAIQREMVGKLPARVELFACSDLLLVVASGDVVLAVVPPEPTVPRVKVRVEKEALTLTLPDGVCCTLSPLKADALKYWSKKEQFPHLE